MSATDVDAEAMQEAAEIEADLRGSSVDGVDVTKTPASISVYFEVEQPSTGFAGSMRGSVCAAIGDSEHWRVEVVQPTVNHGDVITSLITAERDREGDA